MDWKKAIQKVDWLWIALGTVYGFYWIFALVINFSSNGFPGGLGILMKYPFYYIHILSPLLIYFLVRVIKRFSTFKAAFIIIPILMVFALLSSPVYSYVFYKDHIDYARSQFEVSASVPQHQILVKNNSINWYKYTAKESEHFHYTTEVPLLWHIWLVNRVAIYRAAILVPENTKKEELDNIMSKHISDNLDKHHHRVAQIVVFFFAPREGEKYDDIDVDKLEIKDGSLMYYESRFQFKRIYTWESKSKNSKGYRDYRLDVNP